MWTHLGRVAIAGLLLWLALRGVDLGQLGQLIVKPSWSWIAGVLALVVVDRALMAWRWITLVRVVEPHPHVPARELVRVFFISSFVGTVLPGSIGGDAVRAVSASRLGLPMPVVVGSVAVDRLLGTVSVLLMAVVGLLFAGRLLDGRILLVVAGLAAVATAGTLVVLFDSRVLARVVTFVGGGRFPTIERLTLKGLASLRQYGDHRRALLTVLGLSVVVQILRTVQAWGLGIALGITISPLWYFALIPIIIVVLILPISVAGLGSGNLAFEQLFGIAGVAQETAIALSVWFLLLGPLGSLPGGVAALLVPAKDSSKKLQI
jgi:glycosyltransferase 2 family protein